jgi:hypothetical protein
MENTKMCPDFTWPARRFSCDVCHVCAGVDIIKDDGKELGILIIYKLTSLVGEIRLKGIFLN